MFLQYLYLGITFILLLKAGCDEIWEKICSVQGKDPSVDFTQVLIHKKWVWCSTFSVLGSGWGQRGWSRLWRDLRNSSSNWTASSWTRQTWGAVKAFLNHLLKSSLTRLEFSCKQILNVQEISELVSSCLSSPLRREKLATAIENDNYIKKLLNIFTVCEVGAFCPVLFPWSSWTICVWHARI